MFCEILREIGDLNEGKVYCYLDYEKQPTSATSDKMSNMIYLIMNLLT